MTCAHAMRDWLTKLFNRRFTVQAKKQTTGIQLDDSSCGVCVMNAMEHSLFDVPLFEHETRFLHRLRLFVELMKHQMQIVRLSFPLILSAGCSFTHVNLVHPP